MPYPEIETEAASEGTWQFVRGGDGVRGQKGGDRIVVEESAVESGPEEGRPAP